ncbi:MAG TPA: tetratricopeptide repeat protein [Symbiobacteriaceae bacterium]|nr:tetratricopeptide repeat protein [Symbiobacteriaceae bacterium]
MTLQALQEYVQNGQFLEACREADHLIASGAVCGPDLAAAHRGAALAHFGLGRVFAAIEQGEKALAVVARHPNRVCSALLHTELGDYYLALSDWHKAKAHYTRALSQTGTGLFGEQRARVYQRLGCACLARKEYQEALGAFAQAAELFHAWGQADLLFAVTRLQIRCHLDQGATAPVADLLARNEALLGDVHAPAARCQHWLDVARCLRLAGDLSESLRLCRQVLDAQDADEATLAAVCALSGENALDLGRTAEACKCAEQAVALSQGISDHTVINQVSHLRRRLSQIG